MNNRNVFVYIARPASYGSGEIIRDLIVSLGRFLPEHTFPFATVIFNEAVNITRQVLLTKETPEDFDGDLEFLHEDFVVRHLKADVNVGNFVSRYQGITAAIARELFTEFRYLIDASAEFNSVFDIVGVNVVNNSVVLWCSRLKALPAAGTRI